MMMERDRDNIKIGPDCTAESRKGKHDEKSSRKQILLFLPRGLFLEYSP
ncbi:MAG: hypothetical protein IJ733_08225 [Lachnospiraceae bacterium]|nr:hypothetical protein [Lachnospiraceae bacterium]